jgi:hypothetical protein
MRIIMIIFLALMGVVLILAPIFLLAWGISETPYFKEKQRIRQEWREKVNACILDPNCRTDCKLILYRDAQINNQRIEQEQQTAVMTSAMIGSMIGSR